MLFEKLRLSIQEQNIIKFKGAQFAIFDFYENHNCNLLVFILNKSWPVVMKQNHQIKPELKQLLSSKISLNTDNSQHTFLFNGREYVALSNVFSPKLFPNTSWFCNSLIANIPTVDSFLEIGTGTGVVVIEVLLHNKAKSGMGTDISPPSVENARINAKKHGLEMKFVVSDIFENIHAGEKFDIIYWNFPFHYNVHQRSKQNMTLMEIAMSDPGYEMVARFLKESNNYLSDNGFIVLCFSYDVGNSKRLHALAEETGWDISILVQRPRSEGISNYQICLLKLQRKKQ